MYNLIYMYEGRLPWQVNERLGTMELYKYTGRSKNMLSPIQVCMDKAQVFTSLLRYSYELKYDDEPNYTWMVKELESILCGVVKDKRKRHMEWYKPAPRQTKTNNMLPT